MNFPIRLPRILVVFLVAASLLVAFTADSEAKSRKKARALAQAKSGSGKQAKSSQGRVRRVVARRGKRGRSRYVRDQVYEPAPSNAIVPDQIEVIEFGANNSSSIGRLLTLPAPRNPVSDDPTVPLTVTTKRRSVNIDSGRVQQIQQALAARGFYAGEMTGAYDENTIDAMRRFQASNRIPATGYPTAHALKRLGLGTW
ncbi:MAG: peptidoglycan-binding domain-containing protein [Acidobacteriota bacterium]